MANFYDQFRVERNTRGVHFINLGDWHGYEAGLDNAPGSNRTTLQVGCRNFITAAVARLHWRGGVSRDGGEPRPFAEALIALAEALCRLNGWQGWAGPASDHALDEARRLADVRGNLIAHRDRTIRERDATIMNLRAQAGHHAPPPVRETPVDWTPEKEYGMAATPAPAMGSRYLQREINELRTRVAELEKHLQPTIKAD